MPATPGPGDQLTAILSGAVAAILALQNGMSRMIRPTWIMAPTVARFITVARDQVGGFYFKDEMARGMFEGYPVRLTQQIPTNLVMTTFTKASEVYFVDMADFVIADTYNVVVDASDVAVLQRRDRHGARAFQRDQSLFRVIAEHDCNMRHLQSLVVLLTQDWAFSGHSGGRWGALLDPAAQSYVVAGRAIRPATGDRRERTADAYRSDLNQRRQPMPVEGRDNEVVPLTIVKQFASYYAGEVAAFLPEHAQPLVDQGIAEPNTSTGIAMSAILMGGVVADPVDMVMLFQMITNGGFTIDIDGAPLVVGPIDFSSIAGLPGVASLINAALGSAATCSFVAGGAFIITTGSTGASASISYASPPPTGIEIATTCALTQDFGATITPGS